MIKRMIVELKDARTQLQINKEFQDDWNTPESIIEAGKLEKSIANVDRKIAFLEKLCESSA